MKIAVLLPNWVGDMAMATPAIRSLNNEFPNAEIIGVMRPYLAGLLTDSNGLSESLYCEHRSWGGTTGMFATVGNLRRRNLDVIVSLRGAFRGAILSMASGAKTRIGVDSKWFWPCYQRSVEPEFHDSGASTVDRYLRAVAQLGCSTEDRRLQLTATLRDDVLAEEYWRKSGLPRRNRVTMINSGSAQGSAKKWPIEKFAEVARRLVDDWGQSVIVNCGPAERADAKLIQRLADRNQIMTLGDEPDLSFGFLKGLLRRVGLLVSTDSGPRHIAAALGTPTVAIFGSIDPQLSFNYHRDETQVRLPLACSPCNSHRCPLGHQKCTRDLTVDQVLKAVSAKLRHAPRLIKAA